jgi:hypothetical protein
MTLWTPGSNWNVVGKFTPAAAKLADGHYSRRKVGYTGDLFNAIPPAYTSWIGAQLLRTLGGSDDTRS